MYLLPWGGGGGWGIYSVSISVYIYSPLGLVVIGGCLLNPPIYVTVST